MVDDYTATGRPGLGMPAPFSEASLASNSLASDSVAFKPGSWSGDSKPALGVGVGANLDSPLTSDCVNVEAVLAFLDRGGRDLFKL